MDGQNGAVTIAEVHRAVLDLRQDVRDSRIESREAHERLRKDITAQGLDIKENEVRIEGVSKRVEDIELAPTKDPAARWAALGSGLGAALAGAIAWFHK